MSLERLLGNFGVRNSFRSVDGYLLFLGDQVNVVKVLDVFSSLAEGMEFTIELAEEDRPAGYRLKYVSRVGSYVLGVEAEIEETVIALCVQPYKNC